MGLDQYAWAVKERPAKDTDFDLTPDAGDEGDRRDVTIQGVGPDEWFAPDPVYGQLLRTREGARALACWRKHPNLHGFIEQIYARKGGSEFDLGSFHGNVVLDLEDIEAIETATREGTLPRTTGFFFGESRPQHAELTLEFCRRARAAIAEGWTVYYDSSW